jgi:hypothetical protein
MPDVIKEEGNNPKWLFRPINRDGLRKDDEDGTPTYPTKFPELSSIRTGTAVAFRKKGSDTETIGIFDSANRQAVGVVYRLRVPGESSTSEAEKDIVSLRALPEEVRASIEKALEEEN